MLSITIIIINVASSLVGWVWAEIRQFKLVLRFPFPLPSAWSILFLSHVTYPRRMSVTLRGTRLINQWWFANRSTESLIQSNNDKVWLYYFLCFTKTFKPRLRTCQKLTDRLAFFFFLLSSKADIWQRYGAGMRRGGDGMFWLIFLSQSCEIK